MHLFHDSTLNTWRLITDKLPEKPNFGGKSVLSKDENTLRLKYLETIAALKQNALTVGNPRIIPRVGNDGFEIFKLDGNLHEWPGGYKETQETDGVGDNVWTVAILTLPEEKKNTMENMTKEQAIEKKADDYIKQYLPHVNTTGHWLGFQDGYKQALSESSGSIAAPKPDNYKLDEVFVSTMDKALIHTLSEQLEKSQSELASLRQQLADMKGVVKDLLPLGQEVFDSITIDDGESHKEYVSLKSLLSRAKALLDKP